MCQDRSPILHSATATTHPATGSHAATVIQAPTTWPGVLACPPASQSPCDACTSPGHMRSSPPKRRAHWPNRNAEEGVTRPSSPNALATTPSPCRRPGGADLVARRQPSIHRAQPRRHEPPAHLQHHGDAPKSLSSVTQPLPNSRPRLVCSTHSGTQNHSVNGDTATGCHITRTHVLLWDASRRQHPAQSTSAPGCTPPHHKPAQSPPAPPAQAHHLSLSLTAGELLRRRPSESLTPPGPVPDQNTAAGHQQHSPHQPSAHCCVPPC